MLGLSQGVSYAIAALACLGEERCERAFVRDIAVCADVPPAYLAKLFTRLAAAGIIESKRGWAGGSRLLRKPEEISLFEIAEVIEERRWLSECLLGGHDCSDERNCPTHAFWSVTRGEIERELRTTTLADVITFKAERREPGEAPPNVRTRAETTKKLEESRYGSC